MDVTAARQIFRTYDMRAPSSPIAWRFCPVCASDLIQEGTGSLRCSNGGCGFRHYRNPLPAVSVLVSDDDLRLALVKRSLSNPVGPDRWCLPCGYVDGGEDFLTAARREVAEETGLEVRIVGLLSTVSNFFSPELHSLVTVLLARPVGGALRHGDDAVDAGWFDPKETIKWAFEADEHIVRRYFLSPFGGAPVELESSRPG